MKRTKRTGIFYILVLFLLYFIVMQDFMLSVIYKITGSAALVKLLIYSKEIIFILLFLYVLFFVKLPVRLFFAVIAFLGCAMLSAVIAMIGGRGIMQVFENLRGVLLLPGFICIGYGIKDKKEFLNHLTNVYFPFLVVCALIGIIEYLLDSLVGTKNFWLNTVGITEFYSDIKGQANRLVNGFPGNFYGQYGNDFFSVKRLVSVWMGPLTAGYALLIPAIYYFFVIIYKNRKKIGHFISFIILLLAIYLTHTRAIILVFAIDVVIFFVANLNNRRLFILLIALLAGFIFAIINIDKIKAFLFDGSTIGHIDSIKYSISSMKISLFGEGFGRFGVSGDIGTECMYITILGNMGIAGLLLYLYIAGYSLLKAFKIKGTILGRLAVYSAIGYFITGFISEQLIAYTSIMPFYLILGFAGQVVFKYSAEKKRHAMLLNNKEIAAFN